jgi:hypothetical protein
LLGGLDRHVEGDQGEPQREARAGRPAGQQRDGGAQKSIADAAQTRAETKLGCPPTPSRVSALASTMSTSVTAPRMSFMFIDVNRPWRHAKVTDQRTALHFA